MPVEIDVAAGGWREDEDEDDNHEGRAEHLAFNHRAQQVKSIPVQDYIPNYHSDYAVQRSRGPGARHITLGNCVPEDVRSYSREDVDDKGLHQSKGMLHSRQEKESYDHIPEDVYEADVQKDC